MYVEKWKVRSDPKKPQIDAEVFFLG